MSSRGPNLWVIPRGKRFSVKEQGSPTLLIPPTTQRRAIVVARMFAQMYHSEMIVQGRTGRIRFRDSHGRDPFPPRG